MALSKKLLKLGRRSSIGATRKLFVVICPDGTEVMTPNLTKFCQEMGWYSDSNLQMTLSSNKHHSYHGHSLRMATDDEFEGFIKENPTALAPRSGTQKKHFNKISWRGL